MKPNTPRSLSAPERFVIVALLAFGLVASLATPLSAGYDEETHFIRAWEMAHLYLVPNEQLGAKLPFPALYWDLSYRRQPLVEAVEPGFWSKYGSLRMDAWDYVYANVETRSVYFPALLLPQAMALRYLGLSLRLPALAVYYACRLAGLLFYVLLCWLAVRLVPFGKWPLAILTIAPMAVFQASTISADSISNGIGFFVLAASLALAQRGELGRREWFAIAGLLALLFAGKVNLLFLAFLPFLLIPPSRYRVKHGFILLAAAALILLLVEVAGWNLLAYARFTRALEGANPRQQLLFILADPLRFVAIIARDIWTNLPAYLRGWVGVYGYNYFPVPALTYILYPLAVIASLFRFDETSYPDKRTRIVLAALFSVGFLLSIISMYVAFTPARSLFVAGVQGRYFTVVMAVFALALLVPPRRTAGESSNARAISSPWVQAIASAAPILAIAALSLYTLGLILSYHVPCGSEYYRWSLCFQPEYKNWAPEAVSSPPITSSMVLTQEIVPACNGMTELNVWVNSRGDDPAAETIIALRATAHDRDIVRRSIRNADIGEGGWLTLRFAPEPASASQLYLLSLAGTASEGIRVGYSEKPEYADGKLFEGDAPLGQDMLFQYGCVAGLQQLAGMGH
ncbi:MAG TPA: DUF2142 domain-containing protein [Anaerolineales bacterium]